MKLPIWCATAFGTAGLITGAVLAAPTGAVAADGDTLIGGQHNLYSEQTVLSRTPATGYLPRAGNFDWTEGDPTPGVVISGGSWIDYILNTRILTLSATMNEALTRKLTSTPVNPTTTAIVGAAGASGRGAQLSGGAAQLRLAPSAAATHPGSGQAGDLFVDKAARLWFCQGGTKWKQLA